MSSVWITTRQDHTPWKWAGVFGVVSLAIGALLLFLPVHWILAMLVVAVLAGWLALHPDQCFWLVIFTIPFNDRVRYLPVSFSPNEVMLIFTLVVVLVHALVQGPPTRLRTRLDGWIVVLSLMFFLAGVFSESPRGFLGTLKFMEAVAMYYMTVYLIRSKRITRARTLRVILLTAVFQAALGVLQSLTGHFGANFMSNRGYLGYLGLGSSMVWHGKGTMWQFNTLGNYLTANLLLFIPLYWAWARHNRRGAATGLLLLWGLIVTYSRGSLLGLMAGVFYILWQIPANRKRAALATATVLLLVVLPTAWFFAHSAYVETVSYNERLKVWQVPMAAIHSSSRAFWLGSGLNSYEIVAWPYIPGNVPMHYYYNWFAHNFYLLTMVEMGLVGTVIFMLFLGWLLADSWRQYRASSRRLDFNRVYGLSVGAAVVSIFFVSIFDHAYGSTYFKVFLFLLLGLLYVHPVLQPRTRHEI